MDDSEVERLWRLHVHELVRFATLLAGPDDAQDLVADTFMRFGRTRLPSGSNERAYLFRSVRNAAVDRARSRGRRERRELATVVAQTYRDLELPDQEITAAVAALSVRQRAAVYFAYWEDLTEPEIAEILGVSTGSVRRHLARARTRLRKALS